MKIAQLRNLLKFSNLTPEEFGEASGLSGMTVRRWIKQSPTKEIPKAYAPALREACYELAAQGRVELSSEPVQAIVLETSTFQSEAVARHLGVNAADLNLTGDSDRLLLCLNQIGNQTEKQKEVNSSQEQLSVFKKMGAEWSRRITLLWKVTRSEKLNALDKLVAFGALFYLVTPFDLIPDNIPVIGLMDDFLVLGIAAAYYTRKYQGIVSAEKAD
jgi:uncharacterized membrane protein YkvA (DUF1232 family)